MPDITLKDGSVTHDPRLDRLVQFDPRSRNFSVADVLTAEAKPRSYTWRCPLRLNQGNLGACVAFSWHHELAAKPVPVQGVTNELARQRYCAFQAQDYWLGESASCGLAGPHYEGTSVIAGAQVLQQLGLILEYRWAFSLDDLILAVGYKGPAVIGVNWYEGMMHTDAKGYLHPTGSLVGGHAILANRVSIKERFFGLANTWGQGWGVKDTWGLGGSCRISFDDMGLLLDMNGEACIPIVRKLS